MDLCYADPYSPHSGPRCGAVLDHSFTLLIQRYTVLLYVREKNDTKQHSLGSHCCVFVILITYSPYSCSMVVKFSVRELSEVKRVSSPHLRLLGFKPLDCLKDYHNLRPSTFIYPSDEVVTLPFMLLESHHYLVVV